MDLKQNADENMSYEQLIAQESEYWGKFQEEADGLGIPVWCDLKRGTKLSRVICSWMYDPQIQDALKGDCRNRLIETACRSKGRALDLGCGAGWLSLELARRGMSVDGFEISARSLAIAEKYLKANPFKSGFGSVSYSIKDLNTVDLEKSAYQAVVSWDTLHHIPEIESLMRRISASLLPGGYFIFYDHIGMQKPNRWVIRAVKLAISPLLIAFRNRKPSEPAGAAAEKKAAGGADAQLVSPFEDVSGHEMIDLVKKHFEVELVRTQLCFLSALANELLNFPDFLKYRVFRALKAVDDLLISSGLVRGEYVFVVAKKRGGAGPGL